MSEEQTRDFLARLWELQRAARMTDKELAGLLGCSVSYLSHLRKGRPGRGKRVGLTFVLAAIARFPELSLFLVAELPGENYDVSPRKEGEQDSR